MNPTITLHGSHCPPGCKDSHDPSDHGSKDYWGGPDPDWKSSKSSSGTCFIATPEQQAWMTKMGSRYLAPHAAGRALLRGYRTVSPILIHWLRKMPRTAATVSRTWHAVMPKFT